MTESNISAAALRDLSCRIVNLDDEPDMDADELKQYFDTSAEELMASHNALVQALTQQQAAGGLGFSTSSSVPADNVQQAIESVQAQLTDISVGTLPLASISRDQLADELVDELDSNLSKLSADDRMLASQASQISQLEQRADTLEALPFGVQFPLMVLALAEGLPDAMKEEVATAALGCGYESQVFALGEQLATLCAWKGASVPSDTFRQKQTLTQLLADVTTRNEISSNTVIYRLIHQSPTADELFTTAQLG